MKDIATLEAKRKEVYKLYQLEVIDDVALLYNTGQIDNLEQRIEAIREKRKEKYHKRVLKIDYDIACLALGSIHKDKYYRTQSKK